MGLYHGLVSGFAVRNTEALIDMHDGDANTVCLRLQTLCNNGGV